MKTTVDGSWQVVSGGIFHRRRCQHAVHPIYHLPSTTYSPR